jgi:ubiquinone/menaquinone biosynthesis C-methylase UbiE
MTMPAFAMNNLSFPEMYEQVLVRPLFMPWAEVLINKVTPADGNRVLDVACGTGIVARLAKEKLGASGHIVGIDLSPAMLSVARTVAPEIEWREGNAIDLPIAADEKFDVVYCHQGLQFVPDKEAAAREMRRVMTNGGRLVVATWRPSDEIEINRALHAIAERLLGPIHDARHGFGDSAALESLLANAGFQDVSVENLSRTVRFSDGALFIRLNTMALTGMSQAAKEMSDVERAGAVDAIVQQSLTVLSDFSDGSGLAYELKSNVATARA